jgi:hypothetical protein
MHCGVPAPLRVSAGDAEAFSSEGPAAVCQQSVSTPAPRRLAQQDVTSTRQRRRAGTMWCGIWCWRAVCVCVWGGRTRFIRQRPQGRHRPCPELGFRARTGCRRNRRFRTVDLCLDGISEGGSSDLLRASKWRPTAVRTAALRRSPRTVRGEVRRSDDRPSTTSLAHLEAAAQPLPHRTPRGPARFRVGRAAQQHQRRCGPPCPTARDQGPGRSSAGPVGRRPSFGSTPAITLERCSRPQCASMPGLDQSAYTLYHERGMRLVATERGVMHVARRARRSDLDPGGTKWQQTPR